MHVTVTKLTLSLSPRRQKRQQQNSANTPQQPSAPGHAPLLGPPTSYRQKEKVQPKSLKKMRRNPREFFYSKPSTTESSSGIEFFFPERDTTAWAWVTITSSPVDPFIFTNQLQFLLENNFTKKLSASTSYISSPPPQLLLLLLLMLL